MTNRMTAIPNQMTWSKVAIRYNLVGIGNQPKMKKYIARPSQIKVNVVSTICSLSVFHDLAAKVVKEKRQSRPMGKTRIPR